MHKVAGLVKIRVSENADKVVVAVWAGRDIRATGQQSTSSQPRAVFFDTFVKIVDQPRLSPLRMLLRPALLG